MDYSTLMHAHKGIIYLFLLSFVIKVGLLLFKTDTFVIVSKKTKVLEMIFGTLIIVTGASLLFMRDSIDSWLWIKVVLVLAGIGLGIVGLKRQNKVLAIIALALFVYVFRMAQTKSLTLSNTTIETPKIVKNQYHQFENSPIILSKQECARIHANLNTADLVLN